MLEAKHPDDRQLQNRNPFGLEKALTVLITDYSEQFIPLLVKLLENQDKQIRLVAIEQLGKWNDNHANLSLLSLLPNVVRKHLYDCRDSGRFRELQELVTLWSKITGSEHELAVLANEILAFVVNYDLQDEEIEAYLNLAKAVAAEHRIDLTSRQLQIFLLRDEESQWLNYCIELPEEYEVEQRWQLNSALTAKIVESAIPLKLKKNVVIMFK